MPPNDASPSPLPPPRPVCGGPFDGEILAPHHARHWVLRVPGATRESIVYGDDALGSTLYQIQWADPSRFVLTVVRGVYHRPRDLRQPVRYLDLFIGAGSYGQRRYLDLADFLMLHAALTLSNDWLTRRHSRLPALRVLESWRQSPDVIRRATEYLNWLLLDELSDD